MQIDDDDDDDTVEAPAGVRLRDPDDTDGVREDIETGVMKAMQNYVHGYEYGGTRLELSDLAYADKPRYSLAEQREALLKDSTLARRLRGTVTLVDTETNKPLEVRKNMTLARVPYLTQRGTMIHNGSEYAPCFHGTTKIWTEHGLMEIRKIVNGRLPVRVWSWDFTIGKLVLRQVTNWFIRPSPDGVGRLAMNAPKGMNPELMKGKTNFSTVWCTPEHNIFAPDGSKLPASEAPTVSMVLTRMNANQRQMLIGTMLGDGTIQAPGVYRVSQCAAQREYVEMKRRIMQPFVSDGREVRDGVTRSVLPSDKARGDLTKKSYANCRFETCGFVEMGEWRQLVYPDGVRNLDNDWFQEGDERALAFWFGDDGAARYQRTTNSPSVTLHTNNFTSKDVDKLRAWLLEKWGIDSRTARKYGKKHGSDTDRMISITGDACWNFLELVAPYIPACLHYKLLERPKTGNCRNNCGRATDPNRKVCTPCYYAEIRATPGPLSKAIRYRFGGSEAARLSADRDETVDDTAILTRWQRIQDSAGTAVAAMTADAQPIYELREIPTSYGFAPEMQYSKARKVFDIEVEGTHNYFANGVLVSNCSQSRLLPGVYTRKRNNGELESHFNVRPGTGSAMRMSLDPTTGQYRLRVGTSNVHAYSVFKDLGVSDAEMERRWGPEILEANRDGYDSRAIDRVYMKAIPKWQRDAALPKADKARNVVEAFTRAQVAGAVLRENLPNLYSREKAASWRSQGLAMEKLAGGKLEKVPIEDQGPPEAPPKMSLAAATKAILLKQAAASPAKLKPTVTPQAHHRYLADDDEHEAYESIGIDGLLAASEKLLAVNRGLENPDQRDTASNERVYTVDRLMAERVKLDHGKTLRTLMGRLSRRKNLSALGPAAFDSYTVDYLKGNPTASAIEEINPMNIMEQRRRITKMGPGGIGDPNAITVGMQSVDSSQFGFFSPSEGPECFDDKTEVYTSRGWVPWPEVTDDELFACRINGKLEWHKAERLVRAPYAGIMLVGEHETIRMAVTPNHRVLNTRDVRYRIDTAGEVFGKSIRVPIRHEPYEGDAAMTAFALPEIPITNSNQRVFEPFEIGDWCAYMGWWLSEGNSHMTPIGKVNWEQHRACISQCAAANPENYQEIKQLCLKMGICDGDNGKTFISGAKQFASYFSQWTNGCYDKWIPEELQHAPVHARQRMLDALLKGDGRYTVKRHCYCTVSRRLAESVERLAIGLGYTAFIREERDNRPHVKTTNHIVSIHRQSNRSLHSHTQKPHKLTGRTYGDNWRQEQYDGMVYCATVPGGLLHVRGKKSNSGFWSGNSEKAGIDVRLSYGARIGSDGRIYQLMRNARTGKKQWVSPSDLKGKTVRLPD